MTDGKDARTVGTGTGRDDEVAYDALVARLEKLVSELEAGGLSLEGSIEKFGEGVRLARECTRKLDEAERRVELLVRNADGSEEAVAFDPERGQGA